MKSIDLTPLYKALTELKKGFQKESVIRYVWLNLNTGQFSDSWDQEMHEQEDFLTDEYLRQATEEGWKLIKYECINDPNFEFYHNMCLK